MIRNLREIFQKVQLLTNRNWMSTSELRKRQIYSDIEHNTVNNTIDGRTSKHSEYDYA